MRKPKATPDYSWIDNDPEEGEVETNDDGSQFIPIYFVERKLFKLDSHWGTEDFHFQLFKGVSNAMLVQSSLELVVTYGGRTRRIVGSTTAFVPADVDFTDPLVNSNYSGTLKSENIKNAAKTIGNAFGAALNERDIILTPVNKSQKNGKQKPPAVKMKPDSKIQKQYDDAMDRLDTGMMQLLESIYDFNQPEKTTTNAES